MKRVLITGITGYIGLRLAQRLLPDWEVYGLVRTPVRTEYIGAFQGQIKLLFWDGSYTSVARAVQECKPDIVYHLAAYYTGRHGEEDTPALIQSNIVFGGYLLEAMVSCGCRNLIYANTVMCHYQGDEYRPLNLYAATKRAFSDLMAYYSDAGMLRTGTLVLSDTYGPGDHRPKILNLIKQAIQTNETMALSDGQQDYDLVHIDDVTAAFELAGKQLLEGRWENQIFQVCSEYPISLKDTVEKLLEVNGLSFHGQWGKRPTPERDMRRAVRLYPPVPDWKPEVSLETGGDTFFS